MNNSSQQIEPKNKPTIIDPQSTFQVEKRSSSKMFWNKRVISFFNGVLSYYKVPKQMNELNKMQPKISVMIENILYIGPPEKPKKANSLEITFMAKDAIFPSKSKNRSTNLSVNSSYGRDLMAAQQPIVIAKKKEVIIWEISFTKQEILKEFTSIVDKVKHPEKHQEQDPHSQVQEQKQIQTQNSSIKQEKPELVIQQNEALAMAQQLEQQRQEQLQVQQQLEIKIQQEQQEHQQEIKSRIEKEQQLELENKQLVKKLDEQKNKEIQILSKEEQKKLRLKEQIRTAWNYNFLQAIELANLSDPKTIEECITNSFVLHESIGQMRDNAIEICQTIIDELSLPNSMKSIKPTDCFNEDKFIMYNQQENSIDFGDDFYCFGGFYIKLSFCQLKTVDIQTHQGAQEIQIYDETQLKALGNGIILTYLEFRYLSLLADQIELLIQEDVNYPLRVPLSCVIDYKGVRAFAMAIPPIDDTTLIHGLTSENEFITNNAIQQYMKQLGEKLNLKQHQFFEQELISNQIPMSLFQEVHKLNKDYFELRWLENDQNIKEFPPQNLSIYYLLKCGDLMPVMLQDNIQHTHRLRPEFVRSWSKPLNADAFIQQIKTNENDQDIQELKQACSEVKEQQIHELINKFESLEFLPQDSTQLSDYLHQMGINIQMISKISQMCQLQHIKDICICDMIARVCKKVLRNNLADLMKNLKQQISQKLSSDQSNILEFSMLQELSTKDVQDIGIVIELTNKLIHESCLDFLNLLLGVGKESNIFWNQIIQKQIWFDFNYSYDVQLRFQLECKGLLLYCIQQQCDIQFNITQQLINNIFQESFPLKEKPVFNVQQKSYLLNTSKIARKSKRRNLMNQEQLFQSIKWALELCLMRKEGDEIFANLLCEESEDNALKALNFTRSWHPSQLRPLLQLTKININQLDQALSYFQEILQLLEMYFGPSHPYYFLVYSIFGHYLLEQGYYNDACNLYQSALSCSVRLFQNHQCIADIYSELGQLFYLQKDFENSKINYEKAAQIYESCNLFQSTKYSNCLLHQGQLYFALNQTDNALLKTEKSIDILYNYEYSQTDLLIEGIKLLIQICTKLNSQNRIHQLTNQLQLLQMRHQIIQ